MSEPEHPVLIYWDASAVLSVLLKDKHSKEANQRASRTGFHFLSTLSYAEVLAVLFRIRREKMMPEVFLDAAEEFLDTGPWRRLNTAPAWKIMKRLLSRFALRGADLWHLAVAKSLQDELPELRLLTFDVRLKGAAEGENLSL